MELVSPGSTSFTSYASFQARETTPKASPIGSHTISSQHVLSAKLLTVAQVFTCREYDMQLVKSRPTLFIFFETKSRNQRTIETGHATLSLPEHGTRLQQHFHKSPSTLDA